ncbi:MAG: type II toxin-antitoxin system VapB family antitoxin, partial [Gaiellaceae bacterium]
YTMALNIKDLETERLAAEVAKLTGESKTGAVRVALRERKRRLELEQPGSDRASELARWLEDEVWPSLPPGRRGRAPSQEEQDELLGYGRHGA